MDEEIDQIRRLKQQGFFCSQIIGLLTLDLRGGHNPEFIAGLHGLAGGLGFTGEICGSLTAAVTCLGLYAGKGTPDQEDDPRLLFMIEDLVKWFKETYTNQYGGIRCEEIVGENSQFLAGRCPLIVADTYQKMKEILVENGFDLSGGENAF